MIYCNIVNYHIIMYLKKHIMSVVVQVLHLVKVDTQHLQPALSWSQGHFSHMCWLCKHWCYVLLLLCIDVHVFIMCWHRTTVGVSWMFGISTHTNSLYLYVWLPWFRATRGTWVKPWACNGDTQNQPLLAQQFVSLFHNIVERSSFNFSQTYLSTSIQ